MAYWRWATPLCMLLTAPAAAQDGPQQTVGGAQRFLQLLADSGRLVVEEPHRGTAYIHYRVSTLVDVEGCSTRIEAQPIEFPGAHRPPLTEAQRAQAVRYAERHGFGNPPFTIDWSIVTIGEIVDPANGTPYIVVGSASRTLRVALAQADQTLHRRLMYAMHFLKEACDPTAETGF